MRGTAHALAWGIDLTTLRLKKRTQSGQGVSQHRHPEGGNHFMEVDQGEDESLYLLLHSASRHLGLEIAKAYQAAGCEQLSQPDADEMEALVFLPLWFAQ